MAGIDKTYTDSYKEYEEFKTWVIDKVFTFNYGKKTLPKKVSNWVYDWSEEDFDGRELPIMNTPTWLDKYLFDNCPCDFVISRLNEVYEKGFLKNLPIGEIPIDFKQNRKISIKNNKHTKYTVTNKAYNGTSWWLQTTSDLSFSEELDAWVNRERFPQETDTMHFKTVKSMVRRLRKMYLPKGIEFRLLGRLTGETYIVKIK